MNAEPKSTLYSAPHVHGREGEGLESIAPPLVKSQWVLQDDARLAKLVLDGVEGPMDVNGTTYTVPDVVDHMPGVRDLDYTDEQIADVLTFVRKCLGQSIDGRQFRTGHTASVQQTTHPLTLRLRFAQRKPTGVLLFREIR